MNLLEKCLIKIPRSVYAKYVRFKIRQWKQRSNYSGTPILSAQAGNDLISDFLDSPSAFMVSRFGSSELDCVVNLIQMQRLKESRGLRWYINTIQGDDSFWRESTKRTISNNGGFFPPTDETLARFSQEFLGHIQNIDVLAVWFIYYEDYVFLNYCPSARLVLPRSLEPYYHNKPWSRKLKGKKVLIIHPFEQTIRTQFRKRSLLFENKDVLSDFDLRTVKAVQSIAGNKTGFKNWFEAYNYMCEQIMRQDFDVAIIGAGAYGLPLSSFVKQMGKKAIHMGGATQILFGIKGKRWDEHEYISKLYNEHWVRPIDSEIPESYKNVEDGCYW